MKKTVLAYSGGLDTTVILHWLAARGYEVTAMLLDIGQQVEDLDAIGQRARRNGAARYVVVDAKEELLRDYFLPCLQAHCRYEGRYLMGTSIARPLIAKHQVQVARDVGANSVAHGATGKGNDQVRFELGYMALDPRLEILPVWRDPAFISEFSEGRISMLNYVEKHGLEVKASAKKPWSTDDNLLHISYEAGVLEDPWLSAPRSIYERMVHPWDAPNQMERFIVHWKSGVPVAVSEAVATEEQREGLTLPVYSSGKVVAEGLLDTFRWIDAAAARHGVGSLGMVESRYVGMKSRGEYQAPGHTVLLAAHSDLEGICLTGSLIQEKQRRMPDFAQMVYTGHWFDPACEAQRAFVQSTQKAVNGDTRVALYKGNVIIEGRRSDSGLYDFGIATMNGEGKNYRQEDASGFIKLHALPLKMRALRQGAPGTSND